MIRTISTIRTGTTIRGMISTCPDDQQHHQDGSGWLPKPETMRESKALVFATSR
jgi:hypothetical protein